MVLGRRLRQRKQDSRLRIGMRAPKFHLGERPKNLALLLASILVSYLALEAGWRTYYYYTRRNQIVAALSGVPTDDSSAQCSIYDPQMGYLYRPNVTGDVEKPFRIHFHINSWGHVSDDEYPLEKPANEYRIAAVGDSFTANINNTVRWPALLEERLNKNPEWLRFVHGKRTRVINLGRDGIGIVQMDKVLLLDGMRFSPDLVILSFPPDDMTRKPYFRGYLPNMSAEQKDDYVKERTSAMLKTLPWFTFYPEALAALTKGELLPSKLSASIQLVNEDRHYSDKDEAVAVDVKAIKTILSAVPNTLILLHPQHEDFKGVVPSHLVGVLPKLEKQLAGIHIEHMINRFPKFKDEAELNSWFNYPYDLHMSDKGLGLYAKCVETYVVAVATGHPVQIHADLDH